MAPYRVPCTDLGPFLLASSLAPHRVPGTDLGTLFASIRPDVAPGDWHRFGPSFRRVREAVLVTTLKNPTHRPQRSFRKRRPIKGPRNVPCAPVGCAVEALDGAK